MPDIPTWAKRWIAVLATVMIHSCATQMAMPPNPMTTAGVASDAVEGQVVHGLRDAFLRDPPVCVVVRPVKTSGHPEMMARDVEAAVERFLAIRVDRVLAGAHRDRLARHLALDLERPDDLEIFAARSKCHHALSVTIGGGGLSYAVVWAERRIGLVLRLARIADPENPLWSASDSGVRGDGGLPFTPIGIVGALVRAGQVAGNQDQGLSLLDDVLRRMMRSLPDMRGLATVGGYQSRLSMNSTVMPSGSRK